MRSIESLRPFYFIVVVWGEKYLDYLANYCFPSLLAKNNIPCLYNEHGKNKFLVCCPKEDWESLQKFQSVRNLKEYLELVHIDISFPLQGISSCTHMGIGHKKATEICFRDKAYGIALTPDLMLSDGALKVAQEKALEGKHIVYCAAMRFSEEAAFAQLHSKGYHPERDTAHVISLSGRELATIALSSLHNETISYDIDLPYLNPNAPSYYRKVDSEGILLHSLAWCPLLLDYSVLSQHDTSTFDGWTFDGDYVYKNFSNTNEIYVCQDSDELMLLSWTPNNIGLFPLVKQPFTQFNWTRKLYYSFLIRYTFYNNLFDEMKKSLFILPIYIHSKDMQSDKWPEVKSYFNLVIIKHYKLFKKNHCRGVKNNFSYATQKIFIECEGVFFRKGYRIMMRFLSYVRILSRIIRALIGNKEVARHLKLHPKYGVFFEKLFFYLK